MEKLVKKDEFVVPALFNNKVIKRETAYNNTKGTSYSMRSRQQINGLVHRPEDFKHTSWKHQVTGHDYLSEPNPQYCEKKWEIANDTNFRQEFQPTKMRN